MRNGTTPSQAEPSKVSIARPVGISERRSDAGTGQCANNKSCQRCVMIHGPRGNGQGRCCVAARMLCIENGIRDHWHPPRQGSLLNIPLGSTMESNSRTTNLKEL